MQCSLLDGVRICSFGDLGIEAPLAIDQAKDVELVAVFDLLDDLPRLPNAYWQEYKTKVVASGSHNLSPPSSYTRDRASGIQAKQPNR